MAQDQGIPEIRAHFPRWQLKMGALNFRYGLCQGIPGIRAHFLRWQPKGMGSYFRYAVPLSSGVYLIGAEARLGPALDKVPQVGP
jgi:hypothetical protein